MGDIISMFLYQPPEPATQIHPSKFFWLPSNSGSSRIPVTFIKYSATAMTLLYSHGNAEDLGLIYDYLSNLSRGLKVNICAYDYTGYGFSLPNNDCASASSNTYGPGEKQCYGDIDAVYNFLINEHNLHPKDIILYGRSIGGGPSCYLASKTWKIDGENMGVGGLILHSAFSSVFRVAINTGFTMAGDMFPNIDRLGNLGCPVYIMHGSKDEIVPFSHGKAMYKALPKICKVSPFWAEGMGHNNIDADMPVEFYRNLKHYFKLVDSNNLIASSTKKSHSRENILHRKVQEVRSFSPRGRKYNFSSRIRNHEDTNITSEYASKTCIDFSCFCDKTDAEKYVMSRLKIPFMSKGPTQTCSHHQEERTDTSTYELDRVFSY